MALLYHTGNSLQPKTVYAGVLNKKGAVNKAWKTRWFVLYENRTLAYYSSQNDVVNSKDPINCIDLSTISAIRVVNKPVTKTKPLQRRATAHPLSKSQSASFGNIFLRMKSRPKLNINGYAFDADKSLTSISSRNVTTANNYTQSAQTLELQFTSQFSFELIAPKRTYTLCCDHAASFNEWIDNLEAAVFGKKLYKGWMIKQGNTVKTWKRRWFIIFNTKEMRYYVDDKRAKPKGSIFLTDLLIMKMIADGIKYDEPNILELHTKNRIWVLSADNKQNRRLWWDRIASMIPECHQLSPIYEDHLFIFDPTQKMWIYKYFVLDEKQLIQFDKIEDCERYKSCTYFNNDLYAIDNSKYVECSILLTQHPVIQRIQAQDREFALFQKENLLKIKTDTNSYYFCTDREVQLDRWLVAFKKLIKLRLEKKNAQKMNSIKPKLKFQQVITDLSNEPAHEQADIRPYIMDTDTDEEMHMITHAATTHLKSQTLVELELVSSEFVSKTQKRHARRSNQSMTDITIRRSTPFKRHKRKRTLVHKHPDMSIVSALLALGFTSINACKRAALAVNNVSSEMAANWLWSNMERPEIHEPLIFSDNDENNAQHMKNGDEARNNNDYNKYYADILEDDEFKIFSDADDLNEQENDSENDMEYLTEIEMKQIEDMPEYGVIADTFYQHKIWDKALIYYCKALDEYDTNQAQLLYTVKKVNHKVYKWYCYRSECYRRLKKYPEAVSDTMSWMEIVFNNDDFDFVEGCQIASRIWMDLKRFNAAKIPIEKGLNLNPTNKLLKRRLARVQREIMQELAYFSLDIDRKHLELKVDIEEKCAINIDNESELRDICSTWMQLIGSKMTAKQLYKQSQDVHHAQSDIAQDASAQRLVFIMRVYGTWCTQITQTDDIQFVSMYDILSMLDCYGIHQLLNDSIHVKQVHIDNNHNDDNKNIAWLQYKCASCFSKEIAFTIKQRHIRNKCVVDADTELRAELYFGYTESVDIVTLQLLDNIYSFIFCSDEVIVTNANDEDNNNNLMAFITKHRISIGDKYKEIYSKYLSYVASNTLSSIDIGPRQPHEVNVSENTFVYQTLKQELLENTVYSISIMQWNDVLCKAKWFKKTYKANNRNWKARDEGYINKQWNIKADQPISLTHLLVLLLYTNNMRLRHKFFDDTDANDTEETAHFHLILEQCMLLYSSKISAHMRFYHAIACNDNNNNNAPILFSKYVLNIVGFKSLTKYYSVAMMAQNNNDMILSLKLRDSTNVFHLDVSYLSDRSFEGESIVKNVQFSVCNIYLQYVNYDVYIHSLLLFYKMVNGQYLLHSDYHSNLEYQSKIVECMDCLMHKANNANTPKYIEMMFNYLIISTPHLFLIKSQYEHLADDIWSRLLTIDSQDNSYKFGDFLSFWKAKNLRSADFVNEYKWNDDITAFWELKDEQELIGPELFYPLNKQRNKPQENVVFIPICKRLNKKLSKNVAQFAIKCKRFPYGKSTIYLQWNLFCPKVQHTICRNVYITKQNNYQYITFPVQLMKQINAFQFQIALRIFKIT